jgi:hypothetical protein
VVQRQISRPVPGIGPYPPDFLEKGNFVFTTVALELFDKTVTGEQDAKG